MPSFPASAQPAVGYFEELNCRRTRLSGSGWMVNPETPLDRIIVNVNGRSLGVVDRSIRHDVGRSLAWIPHADDSGFSFQATLDSTAGRIDLLGEFGGRAVSRLSAFFTTDPGEEQPTPPPELSKRATLVSGHFLRLQGLRIFTDFYDQIERFAGSREGLKLLDWGCGSGRVTTHFVGILKAKVDGVDLDPEAIEWCRRHLPGGDFQVVGIEPPLPFPDHSFDVVVACSVFTHLSEENQSRWLRELSRILRPEGILLATTHGEFAYRQALNRPGRSWKRRLRQILSEGRLSGIVDHGQDKAFDGIAPPGYYRNVYQSRQYTIEKWTSGSFQLLDYIDRGVDGFQDLVVLEVQSSK